MTTDDDALLREATDLARRCGEVLHGHQPPAIGAALADLLAMWLAGHMLPGKPAETARVREDLLKMHIEKVRLLLVENDRTLRERFGVK